MSRYELLESLNPVPEMRGDPGPITSSSGSAPARRSSRFVVAACLILIAGIAAFAFINTQPESLSVTSEGRAEYETPPAVNESPEPTPTVSPQPTSGAVTESGSSTYLPRWVLGEPWQLAMVIDNTIWTPEQKARQQVLMEGTQSSETRKFFQFGFSESADWSTEPFAPQLLLTVELLDEVPEPAPVPGEDGASVSALGLDGVPRRLPDPTPVEFVDLGAGDLRVNIMAVNLGQDVFRDILNTIEFVSDDPLDGFVVSDPRFQQIMLPEWHERSPGWVGIWERFDSDLTTASGVTIPTRATVSVRSLSVEELRMSPWGGIYFDAPDDVWETVEAGGVIDFGSGKTFDVANELLITLDGVERSDLSAIGLTDWIRLAEPLNVDPLNAG